MQTNILLNGKLIGYVRDFKLSITKDNLIPTFTLIQDYPPPTRGMKIIKGYVKDIRKEKDSTVFDCIKE